MEDQQQQQQSQLWPPVRPPMMFQMPYRPMAPPQMFMPQPMPYIQSGDPNSQYSESGALYGAYTPLYAPQFQQQQQQQQQAPEYQQPGYGPGFQGGFQPGYPFVYGAVPPHLVQWPPMQANPWSQDPRPEMHSESSSGRSPNQMQWKRNRDGNPKRPPGWQQQQQKNGNFRGPPNNGRAFLRCESCDRSFSGRNQLEAHMKTHMKCNIDGCSYEGIGKALSDHRQQVHTKKTPPKPLTKENEEEIRKWRDARRRNFPSAANLHRKLQDMEARRQRGELVDEDAVQRQESLKQILAKQAALNCGVAEIPSYYFSQSYTEKGIGANEKPTKMPKRGKKICVYFQKGHCKKGKRCMFLHQREQVQRGEKNGNRNEASKKEKNITGVEAPHHHHQQQEQRNPSLLAKLLAPEIKRDKSHLLQCFRFFVNNNFLLDGDSELKFFEWAEGESQALVTLDDVEEDEDEDEDDEDGDEDDEGEDGECTG